MTSHRSARSGYSTMVAVFFVAAIVIPGAGLALGFETTTVSESERRELTPAPHWPASWSEAAAWPAAFEQYFNDHFLLRTRMIEWRSWLMWKRLRTSPDDTVIAGRDGWLFYAADGSIDDWTQEEPFTRDELEAWRDTLVRRRDFLANRGIPFLFVIAPDKQMVYPEFMPQALHRLQPDYRVDQLLSYLRKKKTGLPILDLRPVLIAAKPYGLLYHRYDTHWNDRGALVAYRAILEALAERRPSLTWTSPLTLNDFDTSDAISSGDRTTLLGLNDPGRAALPGLTPRHGYGYKTIEPQWPNPYGEDALRVTAHRNASLPRMVMFRDSFAARLIPYLSEHFSRASYYWQNEFDFEAIEQEHPDIVVQEFVARHFVTWVPYPGIIPE